MPAIVNDQALLTQGLSLYPQYPDSLVSSGLSPYFLTADAQRQDPPRTPPVILDQMGLPINVDRQAAAIDLLRPSASDLAVVSQDVKKIDPLRELEHITYSGSDIRVLVELADPDQASLGTKQLVELSTLTVSVHREKAPVRACGYINPKGFARGRRTIAGTMVLTQFSFDILYRFLYGIALRDISKDSQFLKPDQLPAFHMTLVFANEAGYASYRRLLGVEVLTDGTVYSSHDMYTEQTLTYMAADFTPLLPFDWGSVSPAAQQLPEPTPKDRLKSAAGGSSWL